VTIAVIVFVALVTYCGYHNGEVKLLEEEETPLAEETDATTLPTSDDVTPESPPSNNVPCEYPQDVDEEESRTLEEYNQHLRKLRVPSGSSSNKPTLVLTTSTPSQSILTLERFEVRCLGNLGATPTITERRKPGEEKPMKMTSGPVKLDVPCPYPVENVHCTFSRRGFDLMVTDEDTGRKRRLKLTNLEREIDTMKSSWSLTSDRKKVKLLLEKADPALVWYNIQGDTQRKTQEALVKAKKLAEKDPMAAVAQLVDGFCSALPKPSSREAEEANANNLHQRVMMGFDAALEKTERMIAEKEQ